MIGHEYVCPDCEIMAFSCELDRFGETVACEFARKELSPVKARESHEVRVRKVVEELARR